MPSKKAPKGLIALLKRSVDTFLNNPIILAPYLTIAFIQLLALEILFFAPRFPLNGFFNPIIATLWGERFIHYPANIALLPKLFQHSQVFIYLFISSYFITVAIKIVSDLNSGKMVEFGSACKETIRSYVHIFIGALLTFGAYFTIYKVYTNSVQGIMNAGQGPVYKMIVIAAPYINLLIGVIATAIFAFVFPAIIIDGKKIIAAVGRNFRYLFGSFWYIFMTVLVPTLFFVPIILLRSNIAVLAETTIPEVRVIALIISVIIMLFIDATIYTAITSYYLLKREES